MSCFYFEGFDEPWKGGNNTEIQKSILVYLQLMVKQNMHFGMIVDKGVFEGLTRNGNPITKTYNGDKEALNERCISATNRRRNFRTEIKLIN